MSRWPPGSPGRLERAALELFATQGYEQTTVAEIAERAGLKERSFYRYFPDKREVLSAGGAELTRHLVAAIEAASDGLAPLEVVLAALPAAAEVLRPRDFVRQLQQVVAASPALAERELIKLAGLSDALTAALASRGADRLTAELCASIGIAVLRQATQRWIQEDADFADLVQSAASSLVDLVSAHADTAATRDAR